MNYKIIKCVQTCRACPSQWDMWTDDGTYLYARFRWGFLSVSLDVMGEPILEKSVGDDPFYGYMTTEELMEHMADIAEFSECEFGSDRYE